MMPGMSPSEPYSTATAAGRPVITASVPTRSARAPSKSIAITARAGSASSADRPARPAAVAGSGTAPGAPSPMQPPSPGSGPASGRAAAGPQPRPGRAAAAQPGDDHRIGLRGRRIVDQLAEDLVVPGGRHPEHGEDLALLRAGGAPPVPLEGQDAHLKLGQRRHLASRRFSPPIVGGPAGARPPRSGGPARGTRTLTVCDLGELPDLPDR